MEMENKEDKRVVLFFLTLVFIFVRCIQLYFVTIQIIFVALLYSVGIFLETTNPHACYLVGI